MVDPTPSSVAVRAYDVGFGDCYLVSFTYDEILPDGRKERHLLIDFGRNAASVEGWSMDKIAASIADRCRKVDGEMGVLDVVVVTHRHKDHLSGFGIKSTAETLGQLSPRLVVRSWTEAPEATDPEGLAANRYLASLDAGQAFAAGLSTAVGGERRRGLAAQLAVFAADQLKNQEALATLAEWSKGGRGEYLSFGQPTRIAGEMIPGIKVRVIGPPTDREWPNIARQAADNDEYWHLLLGALPAALGVGEDALTPEAEAAAVAVPGPTRWLVERLRRQQLNSFLRIVRRLDQALNNTSLILLLKAGERRLLFSGDAQWENWQYALGREGAPAHPEVVADLALVDLYKVGHHGSRNATPRSALYGLWAPAGQPPHPMASVVSTKSGFYNEPGTATGVPHPRLMAALKAGRMRLYSTEDERFAGRLYIELRARTDGTASFTRAP